jgi:hypothetical protein
MHDVIMGSRPQPRPCKRPSARVSVADCLPDEDLGMPNGDSASTPHAWWGKRKRSLVRMRLVRGGLADTCSILGYVRRRRKSGSGYSSSQDIRGAPEPSPRTARLRADPHADGPTSADLTRFVVPAFTPLHFTLDSTDSVLTCITHDTLEPHPLHVSAKTAAS